MTSVPYYDRAHSIATSMLAAIVARYATDGIKPPDTRFVADGLIVYNCDLLAVGINRFYGASDVAGPPAEQVRVEQGWTWRAAQLEVVHLRCSPQISEHVYDANWNPRPADVTASAKVVHRDAEIITRAIVAASRAGTFGTGTNNLALEGWDAVGEESGLVGGRLRVRVGLLV